MMIFKKLLGKTKLTSIQEEIRLKEKEEKIRARAYNIWLRRGQSGLSEENWEAARKELQKEQKFHFISSLWRLAGFREKRLWDFLQLFIIPVVLLFGGAWLQNFTKEREQAAVVDKTHQETLIRYQETLIRHLDAFLAANNLSPDNKEFIIAQVSTVTALQSLDLKRKLAVIQFLRALHRGSSSAVKSQQQKFPHENSNEYGLLFQARMRQTDLQKLQLQEIDLRKIDLTKSNLTEAELWDANLTDANLWEINLTNANLGRADLTDANLTGANLTDANLTDANLTGANLTGANLTGANLTDSTFSKQQVKLACNWEKAIYEQEYWISNNTKANTEKIEKIKQDKSLDPMIPVDCSKWAKGGFVESISDWITKKFHYQPQAKKSIF